MHIRAKGQTIIMVEVDTSPHPLALDQGTLQPDRWLALHKDSGRPIGGILLEIELRQSGLNQPPVQAEKRHKGWDRVIKPGGSPGVYKEA